MLCMQVAGSVRHWLTAGTLPCRFAVLSQMNKHVHGERLAQAHEILAEFIDPHSEGTTCSITFMKSLTV